MNKFKGVKSFIGWFLVETGEITYEQLEHALEYQKMSKGNKKVLGEILVELGYTTEEVVSRAVASQAGVPFIFLKNYQLDEAAVSLMESEAIQNYRALPIGFENGKLVVAMAQPRNIIAIEDISIITGMDIKPVIVADSELKENINGLVSGKNSTVILKQDEVQTEEEQEEGKDSALSEKPAVQLANKIISMAVEARASDVHVEPLEKSFRVRMRIDGVLHETMNPAKRLHPSLVSRVKVMANMDIAERRIPQDGRITMEVDGKTVDIRVASMPVAYGEKLTLRILDRSTQLLTLQQLGFPDSQLEQFVKMLHLPYGFILVTGPTGSGKSTTLYAALSVLNSVDKHIITLEDPIERRIDGLNQMQINTQAGMTFASGLRAILRNDPDMIMVGEIRDYETAKIAVEAALTGHLVLATLHTNESAGAITRLNDMGIEPYLTSSSLVGVVAQRLARVLCPHCKEPDEVNRQQLLASAPDFPLEDGEETVRLYKPKSCPKCSYTGYRGRVGVYELLTVSENIGKMTMERYSAKEIKEAAIRAGLITMRQDGWRHVKNGTTSVEEILRVVV